MTILDVIDGVSEGDTVIESAYDVEEAEIDITEDMNAISIELNPATEGDVPQGAPLNIEELPQGAPLNIEDYLDASCHDIVNDAPLFTLDSASLEAIYSRLSPRDICRFGATCKVLYRSVDEYLKCKCEQQGLMTHMLRYFRYYKFDKANDRAERAINEKLYSKRFSNGWLYHHGLLRKHRIRQSAAATEFFAHRGNSCYVDVKRDKKLNRDIVKLVMVRWLEMVENFSDVEPGLYDAILRIKATRDVCVSEDGINLSVTWLQGDEEHYEEAVKNIFVHQKDFEELGAKNNWGWFDLKLEGIKVDIATEVRIRFHNYSDTWQTGLFWDYVELRRIDS